MRQALWRLGRQSGSRRRDRTPPLKSNGPTTRSTRAVPASGSRAATVPVTEISAPTPSSGTTPAQLITKLRAVPGTNVLLKSELMANDAAVISGIVDQVILVMVAAAFVVGALVVGMVIYTATNERRTEYGILKEVGAGNGLLYKVVASQSLLSGALGGLLGVAFAFVARSIVAVERPQFLVIIEPSAIALTLAAGLVMALAGGLLPARSAGRLAPAEVFRK